MTEEELIPIRYVGAKDREVDHLYGSNTVWEGKNTVQKVPAVSAIQLLKHPEFQDARRPDKRTPIEAEIPEKPVYEPELDELAPLQQIDTMTKAEIVTYTKRQFGIDLDAKMKKADMVDAVRRQMGRKVI